MKKSITLFVFLISIGTAIAQDLTLKEKKSILIENNWQLIRAENTDGQMFSLPNGMRNRVLVFIPKDNVCYFYLNGTTDIIELKPYNIMDQMLKIGEDFNYKYVIKEDMIGYKLRIWDAARAVYFIYNSTSKNPENDYLKDRTYKPFKKASLNSGRGSNLQGR